MRRASAWDGIWSDAASRKLWGVADRRVVATVERWKRDGRIRRVLDAGCGAGRHTVVLVREGFDVYACDRSPDAIAACRLAVHETGRPARIWQGDVADAADVRNLDAAIAFNVVYHGTERQMRGALRELRAALRPGGECFVTLPSHRNRLYGRGRQVEPNTFISKGMFPRLFARAERDVLHHFVEESDLADLFQGFDIASLDHSELWLPSRSRTDETEAWFRVPQAYFWTVLAKRDELPDVR